MDVDAALALASSDDDSSRVRGIVDGGLVPESLARPLSDAGGL